MASTFIKLPVDGTGGGGSGDVDSFNGRTGNVVSQLGDYSAGIVSNTPAGSVSATTVQAAINELDTEKQATITGAASTVTTANLPIDRAVISNASGKISSSAVTSTELSYVSGTTSSIQTQLNAKEPIIAVLPIAKGGTGISTVPGNGKLLIGNGVGYSSNFLSAGSGIAIINGAGTIQVVNTAVIPPNNIDGGSASSVYGGIIAIDGGNA